MGQELRVGHLRSAAGLLASQRSNKPRRSLRRGFVQEDEEENTDPTKLSGDLGNVREGGHQSPSLGTHRGVATGYFEQSGNAATPWGKTRSTLVHNDPYASRSRTAVSSTVASPLTGLFSGVWAVSAVPAPVGGIRADPLRAVQLAPPMNGDKREMSIRSRWLASPFGLSQCCTDLDFLFRSRAAEGDPAPVVLNVVVPRLQSHWWV